VRTYWISWVLGAFAKLQRATVGFVMSIRLSAWNNSASTGRIFIKFDYISNSCRENQSLIKIGQE